MSEQWKSPRVRKIHDDIEHINNSITELEMSLSKEEINQEDFEEEEAKKSEKEEEEDGISKEIVLRSPKKDLKSKQKSEYEQKQSSPSRKSDREQKASNKSPESKPRSKISNSQKSKTTYDRTSLYERSVNTAKKRAEELLMKNVEKEDDYDDYNDVFPIKSQLSSYRPTDSPSLKERFYESTAKRQEFIREHKKENEYNELKECTFSPQKFSTYKIKKSKPQVKETIKPNQNNIKMSKNSIEIVNKMGQTDFLFRQARHSRREKPEPPQQKTSVKLETINRLSSPKKVEEEEQASPVDNKQFTQDTMYRLLRQNPVKIEISKESYSHKPEQKSFLSENSRLIIGENVPKRDFFEDSIIKAREDEMKIIERKKYLEAIETHECTFRPDITPSVHYKRPDFLDFE